MIQHNAWDIYQHLCDVWTAFKGFIAILKPKIAIKNFVFALKSRNQLLQFFYYGHAMKNFSIFLLPIDLSKGPCCKKNSENFLLL